MPSQNLVIYPGSFDPPTNGHLDLIRRAAKLFSHVVVAALRNEGKSPLFTVEERLEMLERAAEDLPNVSFDSFDGLLVDYARKRGSTLILRGIRAISDYEYELQMALMNQKLYPELETLFIPAAESYSYLSSRLVKEVNRLGGDVSALVPPNVAIRLREKAAQP
ncbi:MAG: pantetheine-phosphate adenylyltransferase [Bryobacterales bacterium]|nr:pantetheine-phosphate adenylyltransferase [Acidobacteriota bacterium]MCB9383381.1 pantetheine-phosphate adenylyltransferase [Bryobacterales bacterium]